MKILVVHRQKTTVEAIMSVLSRFNPVVRITESGLDGLLTSRIEHFDLIICGTDLPVITGFELVRSLRTHSVNRSTAVILLTDQTDEKVLHLVHALKISRTLESSEISIRLEEMINDFLTQSKMSLPTNVTLN